MSHECDRWTDRLCHNKRHTSLGRRVRVLGARYDDHAQVLVSAETDVVSCELKSRSLYNVLLVM